LARKKHNQTKYEIIRAATHMFLENGFSVTSPKMIADSLDISTGNLTYHFPTKEHLLAVVVGKLCRFQWMKYTEIVNEGNTSLLALCLELTAMAAICEENAVAKDFYLSAYSHPIPLSMIRHNDTIRAKMIFGESCPDWNDAKFTETEVIVSGTEFATLMIAGDPISLETRIAGALNSNMMLFGIPEDVRQAKIEKVLAMDYRSIGRSILAQFKEYIKQLTDEELEEIIEEMTAYADKIS